jgi:L-iditol 2-dehydrogenase
VETMLAARLVAPGKIVCEEAEVRPPDDGQLLVKMTMASICGSDLHSIFMGMAPSYPAHAGYPGHEGVGEVMESRHPDFAVGDRVLTVPHAVLGACFAEYQTPPASACIKLPETDVPLGHMLMAQQLGTVIFALRQHPLDLTGKAALVIGQGSAGLFFTYLLRRAGAHPIITADLEEPRLAFSVQLGADEAVGADGDAVRDAVKAATGGRGADFVVEAVGARDTLLQTAELAAANGHLLWFGVPENEDPAPIRFGHFFRKRLTAWSTWGAQGEPGLVSFHHALRMIVDGEIDVTPLLSHVLRLDRIDEAVAIAHERRDGALKVSIEF